MPTRRHLEADELEPLAIGAWILGAGGGGSPYHAYLNLRRLYESGVRVPLLDPSSLADDALVAVVSNMGAPIVGQERLTDPALSLEIGGGNAIQPFLVGAVMDLPVVDADTMGRAYPTAPMTSFAIGDLRPYPLTLADIRDNHVVIPVAESWEWMERISRAACTAVGSIAATCKAPRTGAEVKEWGILDTVTHAIRLGRAVLAARSRHADPVEAVLEASFEARPASLASIRMLGRRWSSTSRTSSPSRDAMGCRWSRCRTSSRCWTRSRATPSAPRRCATASA
jgi:DUF917 family protein